MAAIVRASSKINRDGETQQRSLHPRRTRSHETHARKTERRNTYRDGVRRAGKTTEPVSDRRQTDPGPAE